MESEVHLRQAPAMPEVDRDEPAIKEVISKVKSQGLFDQFRKECIADVDTKPAYHNLLQRVESYVEHFLQGQKWSLGVNKNQLRETLRRQLHNSGMMQNGVERIIEQVVNPKILLGIKPKIDEAVCDHLGIDLKARQEEQQKRKQEQQKLLLQHMQQQQHVQSLQSQNVKNGEPVFPTNGSAPLVNNNPWVNSGMVGFSSPSVPGAPTPMVGVPGGNPQTMGGNFPGMVPPFPLMPGWMGGFNPGGGIPPMMPGQPMIPAFPGAPPGVVSPVAGIGPRLPFNASSSSVTPASTTAGSIITSPQSGHSVTTSTPVVRGQLPVPNLSQPPPVIPGIGTPSSAAIITSRIGSSPVISPMVPPGTSPLAPPGTSPLAPPGTSPLVPPGTGPVAPLGVVPAPPGSIPPPPGTVSISDSTTSLSVKSNPVHGTPHIPALLSHTLAKVSEDELTPEKLAVFKTAAAFITKTVNNAGGAAGGDLASIFSPRVLAEAMMADCGKPLTKAEMRAAKRKERIKEMERLRTEKEEKEAVESQGQALNEGDDDKENPLPPPKHNLMDVFQGAEDVSDDEEALDMLMDVEEPSQEPEDKHKQGIVLSDEDDFDKDGEKPPTSQRGKRYNFAWDVDLNSEEMSDVTVSSIHTSDMSSFEDEEEEDDMFSDIVSEEEKSKEIISENIDEEDSQRAADEEDTSSVKVEELSSEHVLNTADTDELDEKVENDSEYEKSETENAEHAEKIQTHVVESVVEQSERISEGTKENVSEVQQEKTEAVSVQAEIDTVKTQVSADESPTKPRKLLALSYHYSDSDDEETREERKARIAKEKEERYLKRQQRRAELDAKKKERDEEKAKLKREKQVQKEKALGETEDSKSNPTADTSPTDGHNAACSSIEAESSSQTTPRKRKNKAEMKEQLLQQKVMEKKAALRRKRTRNRRYASDEFTSIFSDHKKLNQSYTDGVNQNDIVTFEGDAALEIVEMTVVDQECIVETVGEEIETSNAEASEEGKDLVLQCPSPYSDISDRSMSERSEPENISDGNDPGVDQVSSDDELGDLEEVKIVEELEDSGSKGPLSPSQSVTESDVGHVSSEAAMTPDTSRMSSVRSKSNISQDEMESVFSSQSIDKRKTHGTSFSQEEDVESETSHLESNTKSPVKSVSDLAEDDVKACKVDDVTTSATDSPAKDIMGELELEPVSDEDSLGGLDDEDEKEDKRIESEAEKEEGEEKDPDKERNTLNPPSSHKEESRNSFDTRKLRKSVEENASDEGEIKSESEKEEEKERVDDEDLEEKRRRAANRKPIHQVDFGEAEKRARGSRGIYSGSGEPSQDWRGRNNMGMNTNMNMPNYRGGFNTWTPTGASSMPQYGPPKGNNRYMGHESVSPIRAKSPGPFDAESETSSHSRSSVRVRDDVPPPYPIEGVNVGRKHRSPAFSSDNAVDYKPVSPPSPVSSSSRMSMSRSRSRSSSPHSSRSSSYSSLSAASSSRKRKRSKRSKRKKRRRERQRRTASPSPHHSPPLQPPSAERRISPTNSPDTHNPPASNPVRDTRLSSGNESISSDELPNFSDDEIEVPVKHKTKHSRSNSFSSSSSSVDLSKRPKKDSPGSISSSELIYSPTRQKVVSDVENNGSDSSLPSKRSRKGRRRSSSSVKSSSSDLPPVSPVRESGSTFSPHRPSSPISYPPLPHDMSGFQPPLPQEPMPVDLPPLPPQPPSPPPIPMNRPSISEEEEGECPSSPERPPSPENGSGRGAGYNHTRQNTQEDEVFDCKPHIKGDNDKQAEISRSNIEQNDVVEKCVDGKKEDCDSLNAAVICADRSSLTQDSVDFSSSSGISCTQTYSSEQPKKLSSSSDKEDCKPESMETVNVENTTLVKSEELDRDTQKSLPSPHRGEQAHPLETLSVETKTHVIEDAENPSLSPLRPPSPQFPPSSPPLSALNLNVSNDIKTEAMVNSTSGAPNPNLCSSETADNGRSSQQQKIDESDSIDRPLVGLLPKVDTCEESKAATTAENSDNGAKGDGSVQSQNSKDNADSFQEVSAGSPHEKSEQSEDTEPNSSTSRKRSAQENADDVDQESSNKKQKISEN